MQNLRRLPRHAIVARMRAARITQSDIATRVGVSPSFVCLTFARKMPPGSKVERVWAVLADLLGGS